MSDLPDGQASQTIKIVGANVGTGVESNFAEVASDGSLKTFNAGCATASIDTAIGVTGTSGTLLASNSNRRWFYISNRSTNTKAISLRFGSGAAVSGVGITLNPGSFYEHFGPNPWLGQVNAITSSGTQTVDVFEGTA